MSLVLILALLGASNPAYGEAPLGSEEIRVVDDDDLGQFWRLTKSAYVKEPSSTKRDWACATVGFIIESDGKTNTHRVLKSAPTDRMAAGSIVAVKKMRYRPAKANGMREPVYTTATFMNFRGDKNGEDLQKWGDTALSACAVDIVVPPSRDVRDGGK